MEGGRGSDKSVARTRVCYGGCALLDKCCCHSPVTPPGIAGTVLGCAGFFQRLKTEGVEDVYEMVNARTDGTVRVGQFDLDGKVIFKLKDGQLVTEFIKKETS